MFKRVIELKVTKPEKAPKDPSTQLSETEQLKRWEYYADFAEDIIWDAAKLLAGYMMCNCNNNCCCGGRGYGFSNLVGDFVLTICTFGLWLIWVFIRELSN
jgi:hypothetical protein